MSGVTDALPTTTPNAPVSGDQAAHHLYRDGLRFSNPLYFKTVMVPIFVTIPMSLMVFIIYSYNLMQVMKSPLKNYRVTLKMNFFPMLLFATILDNGYDWTTGAEVKNYSSSTLSFLTAAFGVLAALSLVFAAGYTWDSVRNGFNNGLKTREVGAALYSRLEEEESIVLSTVLPSKVLRPNRWRTIINEYMTINVVYGLAVYNVLLVILYALRHTTHTDNNYIREADVAYISLAMLILLVPLVVLDWFMFEFPATASIISHYYVITIFAVNFTLDFFNQVKYCEMLTLGMVFVGVFLFIYKIKLFSDIGRKVPEKND